MWTTCKKLPKVRIPTSLLPVNKHDFEITLSILLTSFDLRDHDVLLLNVSMCQDQTDVPKSLSQVFFVKADLVICAAASFDQGSEVCDHTLDKICIAVERSKMGVIAFLAVE
jgi:hypothetical protein